MDLARLLHEAWMVADSGYTLSMTVYPVRESPVHVYICEPLDAQGGSFTVISIRHDTITEALSDALQQFAAIKKKPVLHPYRELSEREELEIEEEAA